MSSNNKNKNNSSRGHGPMKINEKPEDFALSIKRLLWSLRDFKVLIFVALILAALSSVLSLVAPNKLSDLTDEISRGITINTTNMKELEDDLTSNVSEIGSILDINIDENTIYRVNTSNISDDDKALFNDTIKKISDDEDNAISVFCELPRSVLDIIVSDSTYNDIYISKEDKINAILAFRDIDVSNRNYTGI